MRNNIVEELPARKHAPVAAPVAKKSANTPVAKRGGGEKGGGTHVGITKTGNSEEASAERIKQAVYDIRHRAKKEDIKLLDAYNQYVGNSNLTDKEKSIIKEKLGLTRPSVKEQFSKGADQWATENMYNALYRVFVEDHQQEELDDPYLRQLYESDEPTYQIRVTDVKGHTYVRKATRAKITELRAQENIKSVELTKHGGVERSEKTRGAQTAAVKGGGNRKKSKRWWDDDGDRIGYEKGEVSGSFKKKKKTNIQASLEAAWEKTFIADGTISTEPAPGTKKINPKGVNNYEGKDPVVKIAPVKKDDDPSVKSASDNVYAHNELNGDTLAEKAACKSKKKKKGYAAEAVVNTPECEKKPEEEKDMRGYYAKINVIKNKLRSMGAKNPIVLADPDDVEKCWDKKKEDKEDKE
tara:strand:+ start:2378 stop:3610 length:1233 start_codon:yes stop_codon:yes gene_type:complete